MKSKNAICGLSIAVSLQLGMLASSAQTNKYLFSGSETNISLNPGTYIITAYGAQGSIGFPAGGGGLGAEMSCEFNFSSSTTLTLLVGGSAEGAVGGGGGSFVVEGSIPLVIAGGGGGDGIAGDFTYRGGPGNVSTSGGRGAGAGGGGGGTNGGGGGGGDFGGGGGGFQGNGGGTNSGYSFQNGGNGGGGGGGYSGGGGGDRMGVRGGGGGGSIIDSSAIAILAEVSGIQAPDDPSNGEIIITAVPTLIVTTAHATFGFTNGVFGFNVIGPSGSNVVIQASTDLQTWIPLQTNLLGGSLLYFSDTQAPANVRRFYRAKLSP